MKASIGIDSEELADQILEHIADGGTIASAWSGSDGGVALGSASIT
jgi:hypothetical protein